MCSTKEPLRFPGVLPVRILQLSETGILSTKMIHFPDLCVLGWFNGINKGISEGAMVEQAKLRNQKKIPLAICLVMKL